MSPILDLLSSSSKEPSSTIKISPIVPNSGNIAEKSESWMFKKSVVCLTTHPKINNKITDGIFVLDEVRSNT